MTTPAEDPVCFNCCDANELTAAIPRKYSLCQLDYLSGILDCEGTIFTTLKEPKIGKRGKLLSPNPVVFMNVKMTKRGVLDKLQRRFGGVIRGPYERKGMNAAPELHWELPQEEMDNILRQLVQARQFSLKQEQAELAVQMLDIMNAKKREGYRSYTTAEREEMVRINNRMRELNLREGLRRRNEQCQSSKNTSRPISMSTEQTELNTCECC